MTFAPETAPTAGPESAEALPQLLQALGQALGCPACLVALPESGQLPEPAHPICDRAQQASDSALMCLRWHRAQRAAARDTREPQSGVCGRGQRRHTLPVERGGRVVGFLEIGPLPSAGTLSPVGSLTLACALVPRLQAILNGMDPHHRSGHPGLRRVVERLRAHPGEAVDWRGMAALAGLSPTRFSRLFRREHGCSFRDYVVRQRLEHVALLLREHPDLGVAEAAFSAGYGSLPHFNRQFRARHGLSPGAYRRRYFEKFPK